MHCILAAAASGGLSPRVRGNRLSPRAGQRPRRSIPACAGEPLLPVAFMVWTRVYPRVCGGTGLPLVVRPAVQGLSPRVRGNQQNTSTIIERDRSIPACAGEPPQPQPQPPQTTVYPRVCGGTTASQCATACRMSSLTGLSPRVRGNLRVRAVNSDGPGSIPACAGEPRPGRQANGRWQVYPRVCGGTLNPLLMRAPAHSLSPRVRGNPIDGG